MLRNSVLDKGISKEIFDDIAMFVLFSANIVLTASIIDSFFSYAIQVSIIIQYSILLIYLILAALKNNVTPIIPSGLFVIYLLFQSWLFSLNSGLALNTNACLSYGTILFVLIFYQSQITLDRLLKILLLVCIGYILFYDVAWQAILARQSVDTRSVLTDDGERGDRVFLSGPFTLFVMAYGLLSFDKSKMRSLFLIAICSYAVYAAQSRLFDAFVILLVLNIIFDSIFPSLRKTAARASQVAFLLVSAALLYGFFDESWNPYELVSVDASGFARLSEYQDATHALKGSLSFLGVGIAGSVEQLQSFLNPIRPFYPQDIGIAGTAFTFGIPFALVITYLSSFFIVYRPAGVTGADPLVKALFYTVQFTAISSFSSSEIFGGSGTVFLTIALAIWFQEKVARTRVPSRADQSSA